MKYENILLGFAIFALSGYALYLGKTELAATGMGALAGAMTQIVRHKLSGTNGEQNEPV